MIREQTKEYVINAFLNRKKGDDDISCLVKTCSNSKRINSG